MYMVDRQIVMYIDTRPMKRCEDGAEICWEPEVLEAYIKSHCRYPHESTRRTPNTIYFTRNTNE